MQVEEPEIAFSLNVVATSIQALAFLGMSVIFLAILTALFWKNKFLQDVVLTFPAITNILNIIKLEKLHVAPKIDTEHCAICYCDIDKEVRSNCGHTFCGDCLIRFWNSKQNQKITCPLCRSDINVMVPHFEASYEDKETEQVLQKINHYNISCSNCPTTVLQLVLGSPSSMKIFLETLPTRKSFVSFIKGFLGLLYGLAMLIYFVSPSELLPEYEILMGWAGDSASFIYIFLYVVVLFLMIA